MDLKQYLKLIKEHDLSAYIIAKNAGLPHLTVQNIINGTTKNPRKKTFEKFTEGIGKSIEGTGNPQKELKKEYFIENRKPMISSETSTDYNEFSNLKIDDKLNLIYQLLKKVDDKLE